MNQAIRLQRAEELPLEGGRRLWFEEEGLLSPYLDLHRGFRYMCHAWVCIFLCLGGWSPKHSAHSLLPASFCSYLHPPQWSGQPVLLAEGQFLLLMALMSPVSPCYSILQLWGPPSHHSVSSLACLPFCPFCWVHVPSPVLSLGSLSPA